jgi:Zn-dependent protease
MWLAGFFILFGWILSVCLHEFGHAIVAYWGGDTSVKEKGYLTLNPLKYTHADTNLILPIMFLLMGGIALPGGVVYINQSRLRSRWWKSAVSAAGPFANVLLILLLAIPFWMGFASLENENWFWPSLAFLILLQIFAVLFNLLPIPPFDGYGIIEPWLPQDVQTQFNKIGNFGFWLILGLFSFTPAFGRSFGNLINKISESIGISADFLFQGSQLFHTLSTKLIILVVLLGGLWLVKHNKKEVEWYNRGNKLEEARKSFSKVIFNRRQHSSNRTSRLTRWQCFCEDVACAPLRKQLLNLVRNKQDTAERLIVSSKKSTPGKSERWYLEKAIYDLRRGR